MNMQENTETVSIGEASLRWTPPCPDLFKAYPPRRTYGLALVKGGDAIGLTQRDEVFWGIVAGHSARPLYVAQHSISPNYSNYA